MLTVAEQTVEKCCQELKERLSSFITEKETIKGEEQAVTNQSIMQILVGEFMPKWTRMRFRLLENEKDFVIEIYDAQGEQEMQPVSVRFKYEYDWGIESWEEAKMLCNKDRRALYEKWKKDGFSNYRIAHHFGCLSTGAVDKWIISNSRDIALEKRNDLIAKTANGPVIKKSQQILESVGINSVQCNAFKEAYFQITGYTPSNWLIITAKNHKNLSPDILKCLNVAIKYTEKIIEKIKEIDALTYSDYKTGGTLQYLTVSTGIWSRSIPAWDSSQHRMVQYIDHNNLKKCLDFFNSALEKLNNQRKELAA